MTKKDLKDIELLLDRKLSGIASDVATLKEDVSGLKEDVSGLKEDNRSIRAEMQDMKSEMQDMKGSLSNLEHEMKVVRIDILENNVLPRLSNIESCYLSTSKRYMDGADKFEAAIADIEVMKLAIQKNSSDIQELKRKKA